MKYKVIMMALLCSANVYNGQATQPENYIRLVTPSNRDYSNLFKMGSSINPAGCKIGINSTCMTINDVPVIPVMGEFHYTRYPNTEWRKELLKMKAGGINIVSSYIFWIHHEEERGKYQWGEQYDLRRFVELCGELNLKFVLRIGPWCHGEVRNGGIPEWMVDSKIPLRQNDIRYLKEVETWYTQIYNQVKGLMWKDGGPIIGVQIENEYGGHGEHLSKLKEIACKIGFDVPLYTRTGWPKSASPIQFGEIIPLYGDYPDGFWDRSTDEMPGKYGKSYTFRSFRNSTVIATEQLPKQSDKDNPDDIGYPYFTCELGGGMMPGYHRRINIAPEDITAMSLIRIGSGSNMPGYYMYHGGTNPDGKLTDMNETQASKFTNYNDLPVKTYDFQAPIGEFGQLNPHYHSLRLLHLFLQDFGSELANMPASFPKKTPVNFNDDSVLRWSVRSNGTSGYLFVNNYHRLKKLTDKFGVQFTLEGKNHTLTLPKRSITVPSDASFLIPFNMKIGNQKLVYATAQPITRLRHGSDEVIVFAEIEGVVPEFVFDGTALPIEHSTVKPTSDGAKTVFDNLFPQREPVLTLKQADRSHIHILLLQHTDALRLWKGKLNNQECLLLAKEGLTYEQDQLELEQTDDRLFEVSIWPVPEQVTFRGRSLSGEKDGMFRRFTVVQPQLEKIEARLTALNPALSPIRTISIGTSKVAAQPTNEDFNQAAQWKIEFSKPVNKNRDLILILPYIGDVARICHKGELLDDNFYNGKPFQFGLKQYTPFKDSLTVQILPLQKHETIYYPTQVRYLLDKATGKALLSHISVLERLHVCLNVKY